MRFLTAGESHGAAITVILEGFPAGVQVSKNFIEKELNRRMQGYGRGKRMAIESDKVEILSGLRNGISLASPICVMVRNKDHRIFAYKQDNQEKLLIPRPGHADLVGCLKYATKDVRNILERASARETVGRVVVGAICKQFLSLLGIEFASYVKSIGQITIPASATSIKQIKRNKNKSKLGILDLTFEEKLKKYIDKNKREGNTLGGVIEVWAEGVLPGLGSCMHFDRRLDTLIAGYLMSIPSIKGVEIGGGFDLAKKKGSEAHDEIFFSSKKGFFRKTNYAGGIEGGMTNGQPLVVRLAAKPIPTLMMPLSSVNIKTKKREKAIVQRSDVCVVEAIGVIAENMLAIAIAKSIFNKFGSDTFSDIYSAWKNYSRRIKSL